MADRVVKYLLRADLGDFQSKMKQGSESAKRFGKDLMALDKNGAQMRAGLSHVGDVAGRIGVVAAAGLGMVVKSAMDWETAWTGVLKTVDGTPAQLAKLEDGLRGLAVETGFAHAEVAAVAEAAGQLGISTGGIESFTRTMLDMGVSTNLSSEEAATGLARLRNIMGTTEGEIRNTGSAMVELGNNFATTEGEILAMSLRIAGAGRQAGLTTSDVLGLSAAMSSVGIEAEAGGSAISLTMKRIEKSVSDGDDTLALFAETAGMTAEQFATQWGEDAPGALTAFVAGLGKAEESGTSANAVLRELGITGIREADALLRLSGNAEGLAEALATSADGFEENASLAAEAGKFYDTTGQQAKQSWAAIKDAAIDAGDSMLPVVEGIAEGVAGLAGAFQDLPGPIKGAVGPMLSITAILGGGTWFAAKAISGVVDMRQALSDLNVTAPKTAGALGKVGRAATIAGAAFAGFAIAAQFAPEKTLASLAQVEKAILDLADGAEGASKSLDEVFTGTGSSMTSIRGMADALDIINWNGFEKGLDWVGSVGGLFDREFELAEEAIQNYSDTLAKMVAGGNAEDAAIGAEEFAKKAKEAGLSAKETADLLSSYFDALTDVDNQQRTTADGTDDLAGATGNLGSEADAAASEIKTLVDAMREQADAAVGAFDAETAWRQALKDARKQAAENTAGIKGNSDAALENRSALADLAGAWNNQSDAVKNSEGRFRAARKAFIDAAAGMGVSRAEARRLADQLLQIPEKRVTNVTVNTGNAYAQLGALGAHLDQITRPRTVHITTSGTTIVPGQTRNADGGTVPKSGLPYADRYPYLLADGEEVITNRNGEADRYRAVLKAINAGMDRHVIKGMLADGGTVGPVGLASGGTAKQTMANFKDARRAFDLDGGLKVAQVAKELQAFKKAVLNAGGTWTKAMREQGQRAKEVAKKYNDVNRALDKNKDKLNDLISTRDAIKDRAASSFNNDMFGKGLSGLAVQLEADRNDANKMSEVLTWARKKGLSGDLFEAVAQSGDLNTATQLSKMSRAEIDQYERLYSSAQSARNNLGNVAAVEATKATKEQSALVKRQNATLDRLDKKLEKIEDRIESATYRGTKDGVQGKARTQSAKARVG